MQLMTIASLRHELLAGSTTVREVVEEAYARSEAPDADAALWIARVPGDQVLARAAFLDSLSPEARTALPLFGVPFAVKDNIDVAGMPTTAGCPGYAYTPAEDAHVVRLLLEAGAVLIGKTNLDQFATGLVGTRSPYGAPRCVFNGDYISGGSSSGSAVAVASGIVAFALGTDTAGSGRVPAAFNDLVGLKPTRGRVSTRGVVPACRSLDCVSVFAHSATDVRTVLSVITDFDAADPYSRRFVALAPPPPTAADTLLPFQFGIPAPDQLRFFGDGEAAVLYQQAVERLVQIGGTPVEIDYAPFLEAATLLYGGAWLAERDVAVGDFLRTQPLAVHPVVRAIILSASGLSAGDTFRGMYTLEAARRRCEAVMMTVSFLALPTTGTIYRVDEVLAEPFALNANLGYYTNFMNLLDLCGIALPAGFRENRTPFGITLVGANGGEEGLFPAANAYEELYRREVTRPASAGATGSGIRVAVVGAHLSGQPLNHQLTSRNARLVRTCRTASAYRLYALAGTTPPKPGLVHVGEGGGPLEVEIWELSAEAFGTFVELVPPPLAIGTLELEDGTSVKGFVCEPRAVEGARDITEFGGWRAYMKTA